MLPTDIIELLRVLGLFLREKASIGQLRRAFRACEHYLKP